MQMLTPCVMLRASLGSSMQTLSHAAASKDTLMYEASEGDAASEPGKVQQVVMLIW